MNIKKICPKCKQEKNLFDFTKNSKREDGLQRLCRECIKQQTKKSYSKNPEPYKKRIKNQVNKVKQYLEEYKTKIGCIKCGENKHWVLDFHHKDPNFKEHNLGDLKNTGCTNKINDEIKKCIILCKNHHYDFHYLERISKITIEQYLKN